MLFNIKFVQSTVRELKKKKEKDKEMQKVISNIFRSNSEHIVRKVWNVSELHKACRSLGDVLMR